MPDPSMQQHPVVVLSRNTTFTEEVPGTVLVHVGDRQIEITCEGAHAYLQHADGGISILDRKGIEIAEFPPGVL